MERLVWYQQLRWRAFLTFLALFILFAAPVWILVQNTQLAGDPEREADRALALMTLAGIFAGAATSLLASRYIAWRLDMAGRALMGAVARDARMSSVRDEVSELAETVAESVGGLREQMLRLQQEKGRLRALLDGMGEAVLVIDENERILIANPVAEKLLRLPDDFQGHRLAEVIGSRKVGALAAEVLWSKEPATLDVDYPHRDDVRHLSISASPIATESKVFGAVLLLYDVTRLRRLERVRRDFVANVSHELRTPIAAIQSAAETLLLAEVPVDEVTADFLRTIERNAVRMANIVEDLLTLSRLEAAGEEFQLQEVALAEIFAELVDHCSGSARDAGIEFDVDIEEDLPSVFGERTAIRQILENLVENAVKYTPPGGRVSLRARRKGPKRLRIEVEDTGVGIGSEHLPRIFERFYRVDVGRSREVGGTGLGLSIVKHLVRNMKGRIAVESEEGKGTLFKLWLRVYDPERQP